MYEEGVRAADQLVRPGWQAQTPADPRPRPRPTRNGAAGHNRPARPARPSGRRSCDRPARSAPPHTAGTYAAAPYDRTIPRTAPATAQARPANPPCPALPNQSANPRLRVVNKLLFCQSSAKASTEFASQRVDLVVRRLASLRRAVGGRTGGSAPTCGINSFKDQFIM